MKKPYWVVLLFSVTMIFVLTGCGSQSAQTPTTDPKVIYTQVAETVQAQITNNARLTPKPTNTLAPTETQAPTATLRPSSTPQGPTQATNLPTIAGQATKAPTAAVTLAATLPAGSLPDKMLYVSQSLPDGTIMKVDEDFKMTWVIKNVGTTTWDTNYRIRFYAGDRFNAQDDNLWQTVAPGETLTITMQMNAPLVAGKYISIWVITNPEGRNFGSFTLELDVR